MFTRESNRPRNKRVLHVHYWSLHIYQETPSSLLTLSSLQRSTPHDNHSSQHALVANSSDQLRDHLQRSTSKNTFDTEFWQQPLSATTIASLWWHASTTTFSSQITSNDDHLHQSSSLTTFDVQLCMITTSSCQLRRSAMVTKIQPPTTSIIFNN